MHVSHVVDIAQPPNASDYIATKPIAVRPHGGTVCRRPKLNPEISAIALHPKTRPKSHAKDKIEDMRHDGGSSQLLGFGEEDSNLHE